MTTNPEEIDWAQAFFDRVYEKGIDDHGRIPWDRGVPHPTLTAWLEQTEIQGRGLEACVVGCGSGDDAAALAIAGFTTTAFDFSPRAIALARERYPDSGIDFRVTSLLALDADLLARFDLVVENMTIQSVPIALHPAMTEAVVRLLRPGGTLLVLATARQADDWIPDGPPWPLARDEIAGFSELGMQAIQVERLKSPGDFPDWRWVAEFRAPNDKTS